MTQQLNKTALEAAFHAYDLHDAPDAEGVEAAIQAYLAAVQPPVNELGCREAFERWATTECYVLSRDCGDYIFTETENAWLGWQAADTSNKRLRQRLQTRLDDLTEEYNRIGADIDRVPDDDETLKILEAAIYELESAIKGEMNNEK